MSPACQAVLAAVCALKLCAMTPDNAMHCHLFLLAAALGYCIAFSLFGFVITEMWRMYDL